MAHTSLHRIPALHSYLEFPAWNVEEGVYFLAQVLLIDSQGTSGPAYSNAVHLLKTPTPTNSRALAFSPMCLTSLAAGQEAFYSDDDLARRGISISVTLQGARYGL